MKVYVDSFRDLVIEVPNDFYNGEVEHFYLKTAFIKNQINIVGSERKEAYTIYYGNIDFDIDLSNEYYVDCEYGKRTDLIYRYIVNTELFTEMYHTDVELGNFYTPTNTTFRLWAPTATQVLLKIKNGQDYIVKKMTRNNGCYEVVVPGDFKHFRYTYFVYVNGTINEVVDPYAISSTKNSKMSVIIDKSEIKKVDKTNLTNVTNPIIYELSVYDYTISKATSNKYPGTFKGLVESGTTTESNFKTGIDYIDELGITHVQLMPINDFATIDDYHKDTYNWGYDPLQFFCLQYSYFVSQDPTLQLNEFKTLVEEFNKRNIRVNVDVVFNHVYDTGMHAFDKIVPYYYYRYESNGSFCGNDTASERSMLSRYFVDVTDYLFDILEIDGLRFDLMGILDIHTLNKISAKHPDKILYGEGWDMPTRLDENLKGAHKNFASLPNYSFFNDDFRNCLRGYNDILSCGAVLTGKHERIIDMLNGNNFIKSSYQSINYVECHDNYTLYDKLFYCSKDENKSKAMAKFITTITLLARGKAFLHSGQEFYRTKYMYDNTYNLNADINQIDWNLANNNQETIQYFRDLIKIKKEFEIGCTQTNVYLENDLIVMDGERFKIYFNPTYNNCNANLGNNYNVMFNEEGLTSHSEQVVKPLNILILKK